MNKHSENFERTKIIESIDNFLDIFSDIIDIDAELSLQVSKLYLSNKHTSEIKDELRKKYSSQEEKAKKLAFYLKPDCNKLYRIYKKSTPEGIIKIIHLNRLCTYIQQKYPSPDLAGFPFENWTPYRLKTYIHLLFGINTKQINDKTINNIRSDIYKSHKNSSTEIKSIPYYLYIRIGKLKKGSYRGKREYNKFIYATLFQLYDTNIIPEGRSLSRLYFASKKTRRYNPPTLYDILDQLLPDHEVNKNRPKATIYIEKSNLKFIGIRSFRALQSLPAYRFILFDFSNIKIIKSSKKIFGKNVDNDMESLKKMEEIEHELDQITFTRPSQKETFLENMSNKIKKSLPPA